MAWGQAWGRLAPACKMGTKFRRYSSCTERRLQYRGGLSLYSKSWHTDAYNGACKSSGRLGSSNGGRLRRSCGYAMVPLFALVVFCLLGACNCWRSTSQALYGAQISVIRETLRGRSTATPYESLGYLWTFPVNSGDATGLGKSITWAWDPELCGRLMPAFRERCSHDAAPCVPLGL